MKYQGLRFIAILLLCLIASASNKLLALDKFASPDNYKKDHATKTKAVPVNTASFISENGISPTEVNPPVISYTAIVSPTCITSNMTLTGVVITDVTGVPLTGTNRPRIYYRKNAGAWFSNAGTNSGGTVTNSTWSFSVIETDMGGVNGGDVIYYYIIAQDLTSPANVGSNPSTGLVASNVNSVTTAPSSPKSYSLKYNLSGTYTVGSGGNFSTLTEAANAYNNACSISGNTFFELTDNSYPSETFPIAFILHPDASVLHTLTIRPSATSTPVITGAVATPIVNLNGAKYIKFDGRQNGVGSSKALAISNTGTGVAVQFINDAQNNVLQYCVVKAQRVSGFSGTIIFATASASGTGNDNNSIDNNDISESAGGFSNNGIYSGGTAGKENDNISITNNNISNYFNATGNSHGIFIYLNSSSWTITGNRLFQTATRLYTAANTHFGIYITTGNGYTINNNVIGFADAAGSGTTNMIANSLSLAGFPASYTPAGTALDMRYIAIGCSLDLIGTPTAINGNTIGGFAMYTSSNLSGSNGMFCGIYIESGTANIGSSSGNIIGAASGNNSIYVATTAAGTVVGIRAACIGTSAIQSNIIGSITVSGATSGTCGNFTGINAAGLCNYVISNNAVGNGEANNIRIGYALSGVSLSNNGTLSPVNAGVAATLKGITSSGTGNTLSITNNTFRGWLMSCGMATNTGIESSGSMTGSSASVNVNNNSFGTATVNWLNATVDNTGFLYCINVSNTGATTHNINNNDIRGTFFGAQKSVGGTLIRLSGASSANNIASITGNSFSNVGFKFSAGNIYLIVANYALSSTGKLFIDNNKITGNFSASGPATYHLVTAIMNAVAGATADITNNDFSNLNVGASTTSNLYGLYTSFNMTSCNLTLTGNKLSNWTYGNGFMTGIDISDMTGTATCSNNIISNIACQGIVEAIYLNTSGNSGLYNLTNNSISGLVSSGAGGYINGASIEIPGSSNTTQTNISGNVISGLTSSDADGVVTGFYLFSGHSSSTVSINKNKIYNLSESTNGGYVYGIYNDLSLAGNITYTNNYIGDLRAPLSNVTDPSIAGIYLLMSSGQAKVYYNTIHLNASGIASQFSTAAVYADAATATILRNNIFSNTSTHGSAGKTVAYWRGDNNLGAYDLSSDNNLFYAGSPSSQNLIFYDGTNNDQLLTAYKTRVNPRDNFSQSLLPNFSSISGANANYLHLAPAANCGIISGGNNSGILLSTDYDGDSRTITAPFLTDIGADEFSKLNIWTGAVSGNWNDANNWSLLVVPDDVKANVSISSPPATQPVIATGEAFQVANIIINTGGMLYNQGTLKISDSVYAGAASINNIQSGLIKGSLELNGSCSKPQQLAGNIFVNNSVNDFKVSNNIIISGSTGQHLNISGTLRFATTGKTFTTNDNVTLLSTVSRTANVGDVTGNIIWGKVTVERYINTGLVVDGRHLKSWQFLSTPTVGQSVFQSWQENGATPPGYGTIITGMGSGFDIVTNTPSLKFYENSTNTWTGVTNTGNPVYDKRGYMIFVRGDRSVTVYNQNAVPTILRTKGDLYQPSFPPPATSVPPGKLESVGNPYASSIDISYMKNNGRFANLDNDVVVWDPLLAGSYSLGGYQTLSAANNYEPTAGSTSTSFYPAGVPSPIIQSGQAFFVHSSGPVGSVTFSEDCKSDSSRLVNRFQAPAKRQYFRAGLYTSSGIIADGNAVAFDSNFKDSIDADDSHKVSNAGENFGVIRQKQILAVEARTPAADNDTIFYQLANLRKQQYQFRFAPKNMQSLNLKAFLIDKFLNNAIPVSLSDSSFINIEITDDPLSSVPDRFYIVFKNKRSAHDQPGSFSIHTRKHADERPAIQQGDDIILYPNPVTDKLMQLHFTTQEAGTYNIRLLNAPGQIVLNETLKIENLSSTHSIQLNSSIPAGNYLLNIYGDGKIKKVLQVVIK